MALYFALCASLPMLKFGNPPEISSEKFLSDCSSFLKPDQMAALEAVSIAPDAMPQQLPKHSLLQRYTAWEMSLRLAIAKVRASRLSTDLSNIRQTTQDISYEVDSDRAVTEAYAAANPLERERILDQARWRKLEELEGFVSFTFDNLCAYRWKLLILEKWQKRYSGSASENLEKATDAVQKADAIHQSE